MAKAKTTEGGVAAVKGGYVVHGTNVRFKGKLYADGTVVSKDDQIVKEGLDKGWLITTEDADAMARVAAMDGKGETPAPADDADSAAE